MMCHSIIQQIRRPEGRRQLYVTVPTELAEALHLEPGQPVEWLIRPSGRIELRPPARPAVPVAAARSDAAGRGRQKGGRYCGVP